MKTIQKTGSGPEKERDRAGFALFEKKEKIIYKGGRGRENSCLEGNGRKKKGERDKREKKRRMLILDVEWNVQKRESGGAKKGEKEA